VRLSHCIIADGFHQYVRSSLVAVTCVDGLMQGDVRAAPTAFCAFVVTISAEGLWNAFFVLML
jgi:hypothetical protein